MNSIRSIIAYLKARLCERSTWMMIGASIAAAAALPRPWNIISFGIAIIAAMTPDGQVGQK